MADKGLEIIAVVADPHGHTSGQYQATKTTIELLAARGYRTRWAILPSKDRFATHGFSATAWLRSFVTVVKLSAYLLRERGRRRVFLAPLGQSSASWLREGVVLPLLQLLGDAPAIVTLHASYFISWPTSSWRSRWFGLLLRRFTRVVVLGPEQGAKVLTLGVTPERLRIVPNTTDLPPRSPSPLDPKEKLRVLFFAHLFEAKGYQDLLAALAILDRSIVGQLSITLAGRPMSHFQDSRLSDISTIAVRIEGELDRLRRSGVDIKWHREVSPSHRSELLDRHDVLILPSHSEAQPLTLIEAAARGLALMSTPVGEIPHLFPEDAWYKIEVKSPPSIATALTKLITDRGECTRLASRAHHHFLTKLHPQAIADTWESLVAETLRSSIARSSTPA